MPFSKGKLLKLNPNFKIFRASRGSKSGSGAYAKVNFNFPCPNGSKFGSNKKMFVNSKSFKILVYTTTMLGVHDLRHRSPYFEEL